MNRIDTVFVHVTDLDRSVRWYSRLFGLHAEPGPYRGPVHTLSMGEGRPGLTLDDHCLDPDHHFVPSNQPLFTLSTTDIHAAYEHVRTLGANVVSGIRVFPDLSEFTLRDPDGNILMICSCVT